ncbi:Dyp-type peroxidase [Klugiella xanthotipulae]|uniref:Dye decolorizing peroxidase n=1 Tax=Klugiella xanthotipulae TaxID=244735 RepID=A0A543I3Z3_9MICO|nr:Dyp-type peroxidase [Klugiella xanthotipulae]TQM65312.1 dye decolorizing peroxidase [Klugiella xanthotipulae]
MTDSQQESTVGRRTLSRRHLLLGGAAAGVGAAVAVGVDLVQRSGGETGLPAPEFYPTGNDTEPFYGTHQSGVMTSPQAHVTLIAYDLLPGTSREGVERMLRLLTDDAAKLTLGSAALADTEPELAVVPARLTVTVGFGPELVKRVNPAALPEWLTPLPAFNRDSLADEWSGGDLLIQVGSDDPLTVSHTVRMLSKDLRAFATRRWAQSGFRRALSSESPGTTMRNLFGQVDGTVNPAADTEDFDTVVWQGDGAGWMAGGTSFVLRRIAMNLDTWDKLDRSGREQAMGRNLKNGAPLTGTKEHDEPDFEAKTSLGFPVISDISHVRRARSENTHERIFRRGYNYDEAIGDGHDSNAGLLFISFQANPTTQFVPLQKRLDELDLMNEWITHIGSVVVAIPPGCTEGGFIGETLFR